MRREHSVQYPQPSLSLEKHDANPGRFSVWARMLAEKSLRGLISRMLGARIASKACYRWADSRYCPEGEQEQSAE